jgi:UDP-N-acetyl-D-mannosaminuronic acid dehydrogenase
VVCCDPYVPDASLIPVEEAISRADTIIIGVPHSVYRDLEIPETKTVVDIWGSRDSGRLAPVAAIRSSEESRA